MSKTLQDMQAEVAQFTVDKGWKDLPVSFGEAMAMLHSEVSEAVEAWRAWGPEDRTRNPQPEEDGTLHHFKPEGIGSEFADVLIRLLDDCDRFGIDLDFEYERKMAYNRTRTYRHGGKRL